MAELIADSDSDLSELDGSSDDEGDEVKAEVEGREVVEGSHQQGLNLVMMQFSLMQCNAIQCSVLKFNSMQCNAVH